MIKRILLFIFILSSGVVIGQELKVTTNFESGSARVLLLDEQTQTIRITPAGDPKRGILNWWYVKIDGIKVTVPLVLQVEAREDLIPDELTGQGKKTSPAFTWPLQGAISLDGKVWTQTEAGQKINNRMVYEVQPSGGTIWLAWGPPFTPTDALNFLLTAYHKPIRLRKRLHFVDHLKDGRCLHCRLLKVVNRLSNGRQFG